MKWPSLKIYAGGLFSEKRMVPDDETLTGHER